MTLTSSFLRKGLPESNVLVEKERDKSRRDDGDAFCEDCVPTGDVDTEKEDELGECQADDLNQVKGSETQCGLVFLLEIELAIQDETTDDAAMESDDVGVKIRHAFA